MKLRIILGSMISLLLLALIPCVAFGEENIVWVSEDLRGEASKIGYFNQDDRMFTKIISTNSFNLNSFDMSFGNYIISFEEFGGLYGELGVNSGVTVLNLFFGGGYMYRSPGGDIHLLGGVKYYLQDQALKVEAIGFVKIFGPLILNVGYDDSSNRLFGGVGLTFQ
ncbi:MAG TPA: hypothetical protein VHY08_07990 [Bacillota bacterium]|nr:hypothetical protein [Bacillota bacterium]